MILAMFIYLSLSQCPESPSIQRCPVGGDTEPLFQRSSRTSLTRHQPNWLFHLRPCVSRSIRMHRFHPDCRGSLRATNSQKTLLLPMVKHSQLAVNGRQCDSCTGLQWVFTKHLLSSLAGQLQPRAPGSIWKVLVLMPLASLACRCNHGQQR